MNKFNLKNFKQWLINNGSEIYASTNQYELIRFKTPEGTGIIYTNRLGNISSMINGAEEAAEAFSRAKSWRATPSAARKKSSNKIKNAIGERDGWKCLYCCIELTDATATIEHLVALTSGGTNCLANKTFACVTCNNLAGSMSVSEKIEFALKQRISLVKHNT